MINLFIRADASAEIGTGHVMRCLALAQAWQTAGGQTIFVLATNVPALETRLISEGIEVIHLLTDPGSADDAIQTAGLAHEREAAFVVVDGYQFGASYQQIIKAAGVRLLFIDDIGHSTHYYADIVLNQNLHAEERFYVNREPYTQLLLGISFALLRREFLVWRGAGRREPEAARKVLVTLGGSDLDNVTLKVIQALRRIEVDLEIVTVVGESNPHYDELRSAVQDSFSAIRLETHVMDMPVLMAWAEIAIAAGGSSVWELAFMGVPVIGISRAEQETRLLKGAEHCGIALNLGDYRSVDSRRISEVLVNLARDKKQRSIMSQKGRALVDGLGPMRIISQMRSN